MVGEVNDFSKWEMWLDISQEDLVMYCSIWKQYVDYCYILQFIILSGSVVVNVIVILEDGQGNVIWSVCIDVQGCVELWVYYFCEVSIVVNGLMIKVNYGGKKVEIFNVKFFCEGINF